MHCKEPWAKITQEIPGTPTTQAQRPNCTAHGRCAGCVLVSLQSSIGNSRTEFYVHHIVPDREVVAVNVCYGALAEASAEGAHISLVKSQE